jgi:molybdopterin-guanine dinucleotide biosynthesis protein A
MKSLSSPRRDMASPDLPVRVVRDDLPFRGPASGVHCGLQASTTEICFCKFVGRAFSDVRLMRFLPIRLGDAVVAVAGPAATAPSR